ncbi:MAG: potassium-transporting ATPase subunit KdpC [Gammaproteobacteria bacterium]|nr:potassium-transporting ATPase subunit KdpC [Gammaproteobacteria bacterium]
MLEVMKQLKTGLVLLLLLSILTGIVYPAVVTGIAQLVFPWHANGSLIWKNDKIIGSELIGQFFSDDKYFWGRPSATTPYPYNAESSSGSNYGPLNPDYLTAVKNRLNQLHQSNPNAGMEVPVDMVTTSASGLDPEISPLAAVYQVSRIAEARKISKDQIMKLVEANIQHRLWGVIGEPRVNILQLNLALDAADRGANQ